MNRSLHSAPSMTPASAPTQNDTVRWDGRVTVAFRSVGIKALCSEGDIAGKEATT